MIVWTVSGHNIVYAVFSTEQKAQAYKELLEREAILTSVTQHIINAATPEPELEV